MIVMIADIVSWFCLVVGAIFCIIGGIGILRLPDFYSRTHAASITDTLGVGLVLAGLMIQGLVLPGVHPLVVVKLALLFAILFLLNPAASHALAKAAYAWGVRSRDPQYKESDVDDDPH